MNGNENEVLATTRAQEAAAAQAGPVAVAAQEEPAVSAGDGTAAGKKTLQQLIDGFFTDYRAGLWKPPYKENTANSVKKDLPRLVKHFGEDRDVSTIVEAEAEDYMDSVSFGSTYRETPMSANGAYSIYCSDRRLFDYATDKGYVSHNVFRTMDPAAIPIPENKNEPGARVDEAQSKVMAQALLKCEAAFANVRSVLFVLLAYFCHIRPGDLLVIKWTEVEKLEAAGKLSAWVKRLLKTYRPAQGVWLAKNGIRNDGNYVFVNENDDEGKAKPASPGTAGTWLKEKVLNPKGLPEVTINVLSSKKKGMTPQNAFDGLDPEADYPIFGTVTYPEKLIGKRKSPEEKAKREAGRKEREAKYKAKNGGK